MYAHLLTDGTPYEYPFENIKFDGTGKWEEDYEPTLADRIGSI